MSQFDDELTQDILHSILWRKKDITIPYEGNLVLHGDRMARDYINSSLLDMANWLTVMHECITKCNIRPDLVNLHTMMRMVHPYLLAAPTISIEKTCIYELYGDWLVHREENGGDPAIGNKLRADYQAVLSVHLRCLYYLYGVADVLFGI